MRSFSREKRKEEEGGVESLSLPLCFSFLPLRNVCGDGRCQESFAHKREREREKSQLSGLSERSEERKEGMG